MAGGRGLHHNTLDNSVVEHVLYLFIAMVLHSPFEVPLVITINLYDMGTRVIEGSCDGGRTGS